MQLTSLDSLRAADVHRDAGSESRRCLGIAGAVSVAIFTIRARDPCLLACLLPRFLHSSGCNFEITPPAAIMPEEALPVSTIDLLAPPPR